MIALEIITPNAKVLVTEADQVVLPAEAGQTGILSGHIPLVTKLKAGEIRVIRGNKSEYIAVDCGFARVLGDRVEILTEAAIDVNDIDLAEVEAAQSRAEAALKTAEAEGHDPEEAELLAQKVTFLIAQKLAKGRRR
ncbi:MAG: ATP synthase epsilon chain [Opitutia bacterium UBA7350]|nr:MAG: ATP synthase epsilon chain [Opitutae bacterium UBA7350]